MLTASTVCTSRLHHPPELSWVDILEQGSLQGLQKSTALCRHWVAVLAALAVKHERPHAVCAHHNHVVLDSHSINAIGHALRRSSGVLWHPLLWRHLLH